MCANQGPDFPITGSFIRGSCLQLGGRVWY